MANGKKKSKKKLFIFGGLGLLVIVVVALVIMSGNKEKIVSVQTEEAVERTITQVVSATGSINPVEKVIITPEVTGEIVELPVEEGDVVKKGQLLIRIKPDIYIAQRNRNEASLESAKAMLKVREATLEQLKAEYERIVGLHAKDLASESQLEVAKSSYLQSEGQYESQMASVLQAEESLKEAKENLAKTAIYSPINGTVSLLNVEMSERVLGSGFSQGTHLMTVSDLSQMEATVEVDENDVVLVAVGDSAKIEIDAFGDREFWGKVSQIGNTAMTTGAGTQNEVVNFEVKILLLTPDEAIRPGMSCDSDIQTETKNNVVSVPIQSVTARVPKPGEGGGDGEMNDSVQRGKRAEPKEVVFIVKDNVVNMVEVKTGISDDTYIEITEGLDGSEKIVSGPYRAISKDLEEGSKVMEQGGGKKDRIASNN